MYILLTRVISTDIWRIKLYTYIGYVIDSSEDCAMCAFGSKDLDTLELFWVPWILRGRQVGHHWQSTKSIRGGRKETWGLFSPFATTRQRAKKPLDFFESFFSLTIKMRIITSVIWPPHDCVTLNSSDRKFLAKHLNCVKIQILAMAWNKF